MKIKSFIFACLLALTFNCTGFENSVSVKAETKIYHISCDEYIYVRYDVDGVPWIFVYDKGGNLITAYPEN